MTFNHDSQALINTFVANAHRISDAIESSARELAQSLLDLDAEFASILDFVELRCRLPDDVIDIFSRTLPHIPDLLNAEHARAKIKKAAIAWAVTSGHMVYFFGWHHGYDFWNQVKLLADTTPGAFTDTFNRLRQVARDRRAPGATFGRRGVCKSAPGITKHDVTVVLREHTNPTFNNPTEVAEHTEYSAEASHAAAAKTNRSVPHIRPVIINEASVQKDEVVGLTQERSDTHNPMVLDNRSPKALHTTKPSREQSFADSRCTSYSDSGVDLGLYDSNSEPSEADDDQLSELSTAPTIVIDTTTSEMSAHKRKASAVTPLQGTEDSLTIEEGNSKKQRSAMAADDSTKPSDTSAILSHPDSFLQTFFGPWNDSAVLEALVLGSDDPINKSNRKTLRTLASGTPTMSLFVPLRSRDFQWSFGIVRLVNGEPAYFHHYDSDPDQTKTDVLADVINKILDELCPEEYRSAASLMSRRISPRHTCPNDSGLYLVANALYVHAGLERPQHFNVQLWKYIVDTVLQQSPTFPDTFTVQQPQPIIVEDVPRLSPGATATEWAEWQHQLLEVSKRNSSAIAAEWNSRIQKTTSIRNDIEDACAVISHAVSKRTQLGEPFAVGANLLGKLLQELGEHSRSISVAIVDSETEKKSQCITLCLFHRR
ncbi:uncharacterized protein GLRG_11012 [Colletotrichum graminicola M1.001]|uniref:Uncharacterized protein n=1 Tax=Colletotrichum graminicola (strain M1.001 / M2 / FGSC 10212) TaxID=645133 RepID=E3QYG6_COLGM|nr:uncharacterized protein GLRG_11012 [Colletotrichum graminicola M1.001]EFQ35904.1 hypothetical protein GLRG_11012 [Colletotrichum graminicola M1.001]